jgi:hypothetical protein
MSGSIPWEALATPAGRELIDLLSPWDPDQALRRLAALRQDPRWADQPDLLAAAATQAQLRTRAATRFPGPPRWWTGPGMEQATRPALARMHAARLIMAGIADVHDLGCGAGSDALAFAAAGLRVHAVDRDPDALMALTLTAADRGLGHLVFAHGSEITAYVQAVGPDRGGRTAYFLDPARRAASHTGERTVRRLHPESWSPRWSWACELAAQRHAVGAKVAPGIPHELIPANTHTQWISQDGDLLEAAVWWQALTDRPGRSAVVLRADVISASLDDSGGVPVPDVGEIGDWLLEPDPAVIRSGLVSVLAGHLGGWLLDPHIAYVTGPGAAPRSPLGATFEVLAEVPAARKALRKWLVAGGYGNVVIKKRGLDLDPVELRRWLRLRGPGPEVTLVLTRTARGPLALAVKRLPPAGGVDQHLGQP